MYSFSDDSLDVLALKSSLHVFQLLCIHQMQGDQSGFFAHRKGQPNEFKHDIRYFHLVLV